MPRKPKTKPAETLSTEKGNVDFMYQTINDIYTLHDEGILDRHPDHATRMNAEALMAAACREFLTGKDGLTKKESRWIHVQARKQEW